MRSRMQPSLVCLLNAAAFVVPATTTASFALGLRSVRPAFAPTAFLWHAETGAINLGTLGGDSSTAVSVNDEDQVAGWSQTASGATHACVWTGAKRRSWLPLLFD